MTKGMLDNNITLVRQEEVDTDTDSSEQKQLIEDAKKVIEHHIYWILLGVYFLIFIGIYCVCRENKKGKKGKKKDKLERVVRQRRIKKTDQDIEFQNIFSDNFKTGGRTNDMSISM